MARILAIMLACVCICQAARADSFKLPSEVVTLEGLADDFRGPLVAKIGEMLDTYNARQIAFNQIGLIDSNQIVVATFTLYQTLSPDAKQRTESVEISDSRGQTLFKETVQTFGMQLALSSPQDKIFLQGTANYTLLPGETSKTAVVTMDKTEMLRFSSVKTVKPNKNVIYATEVSIAGSTAFTQTDTFLANSAGRVIQTAFQNLNFAGKVFGISWNLGGPSSKPLQISMVLNPGGPFFNTVYSVDGTEVEGLNTYLQEFHNRVYTPFFGSGLDEILGFELSNYFPSSSRRADLSVNSKFLNDLILLKSQIDAAKSNPALLPIISGTVGTFINAIQDNTLKVQDLRAVQKASH